MNGTIEMLTIYGGPGCQWCVRAKELAHKHGIAVKYIDVYENHDALKMLVDNGWKTIPQVFHEDKHIGGYDDMVRCLDGR